jgi:hypothetical protein
VSSYLPLSPYWLGWLWLVEAGLFKLCAIVAQNKTMDIRDRINLIVEFTEIKQSELVEKTGVDRMKWANLKRLKIRAQQEHIEAIVKLFPEYAYWITTGSVLPESWTGGSGKQDFLITSTKAN